MSVCKLDRVRSVSFDCADWFPPKKGAYPPVIYRESGHCKVVCALLFVHYSYESLIVHQLCLEASHRDTAKFLRGYTSSSRFFAEKYNQKLQMCSNVVEIIGLELLTRRQRLLEDGEDEAEGSHVSYAMDSIEIAKGQVRSKPRLCFA